MPTQINKQTYSESGQEIELKNLSGLIYIDALLNKREGAPIKWKTDPAVLKDSGESQSGG